MHTLFILTTHNPKTRHLSVNDRFFLFVTVATAERFARFAERLGLVRQTASDGSVCYA